MSDDLSVYRGRKVLVTGGDGFIGSHLVEALVAADAEVTALSVYNSFGTNGWLDSFDAETLSKLNIVAGDIRDEGFVRRLVKGQDTVFHLAALIAIPYSYVAPKSYIDVNIHGTQNVLEAVRDEGCRRMIHTSTSEVYGTAQFTPITEEHPLQGQSPYSASKIGADMMAESYARSFETPVVTLRPFNTYGPRQSERAVIPTIIRQALDPACNAIRIGDLSPQRDFNFTADTVDAFLALGAAEEIEFGTAYNAATGHAVSIGDVVDMVAKLTGHGKDVITESERKRPAKSEVHLLLGDASRLTTATGWQSRVDLEEGVRRTISWWEERMAAGLQRRDSGYAT